MSNTESERVLAYLAQLQAEAEDGFHKNLRVWIDDQSSAAKVLRTYAETLE